MTMLLPTWIEGFPPLAQLSPDERVRAMRWSGRDAGILLVVLALAVLAYVAWQLVRRHLRRTDRSDAGEELFESLAAGHGLTRREKSLLHALAGRLGLDDPAALFVRKSFLERELRRESSDELAELMRKLFA